MSDPLDQIREKARELTITKQLLQEGEEFLRISQKNRLKHIAELEEDREELSNKIASIRMEMDADDPETAALIETQINLQSRLKSDIKKLCHALPTELLEEKGLRILDSEESPLTEIVVSKIQTAETYDSEGLLKEYPDLQLAEVDGDPVIERSVNVAILERLILQGDFPVEVRKYRSVAKTRNPSVSFKDL
jgi:hypothetical protein